MIEQQNYVSRNNTNDDRENDEEKIVIDLVDEDEDEDDEEDEEDEDNRENKEDENGERRSKAPKTRPQTQAREARRLDFASGQLVWFDPNSYGYMIPGKVIDCYKELRLLTIEAYSQPQIMPLSHSDCAMRNFNEYEQNWLKPDEEEQMELYQLSDTFQLDGVRLRTPLSQANGSADLVDLSELSLESLVWNLKIRFKRQLVYTNCGQKILISVNPNSKNLSHFYNLDQVNKYDQCNSFKLRALSPSSQYSSSIRWLQLSEPIMSSTGEKTDESLAKDSPLAPHIFGLANSAIKQLLISGHDQCFVLMGDSGSGKTETSKLLIQYLAAINKAPSNLITEQILESIQLLESFGNAKTIENDNASRHAKLLTIRYSLESGHMIDALTYDLNLLDRSRIVSQNMRERNYHIFYELLAGLNRKDKEKYGLEHAEKYFYLNQGESIELAQKDDSEDFRSLISSMQVLGFDFEEQDAIFRLLASILHLGNVYFHRRLLAIRTGKLASQQEPTNPKDQNKGSNSLGVEGVEIGSDTEVRWISHLLQIQFDSVLRCLTMRTSDCLQSPLSSGNSAGSSNSANTSSLTSDKIITPLNIDQALDTRDAIAKALYTCLFRWIVQRINATISGKSNGQNDLIQPDRVAQVDGAQIESEPIYMCQTSESLCEFQPDKLTINGSSISSGLKRKDQDFCNGAQKMKPKSDCKSYSTACLNILDAFGFENLSENNFEQLCINYTSELLRYHSQKYLIRLEQAEYERERLSVAQLDRYCDQQAYSANLVNVIGKKPLGILPILDDECNFPKATDMSFIEKCHHNHAMNEAFLRSQGGSNSEFGIRHFNQKFNQNRVVWYQVDGFIEKNRDALRSDLVELLLGSRVSMISNMLKKFLVHRKSRDPEEATVKTLSRTHDGRYVSMKPRQTTISARFQESLTNNLVMDALNPSSISKERYELPNRASNVWFIICIKPNRSRSSQVFDVAFVQEQINCLNLVGLTAMRRFGFPVRLKYGEFVRRYRCLLNVNPTNHRKKTKRPKQAERSDLDESRRASRELSEYIITSSIKGDSSIDRCSHQCGLTKIFLSERLFHLLERKRLQRYMEAIMIMQKSLRMWKYRRNFLNQRRAAIVIQSQFRAFQARQLFYQQYNSIVLLQRRWRAILVKRRHQRLEAKRKAQRQQQLNHMHEIQAQQQANQMRYRQVNSQGQSASECLDVPAELAQFYRLQRGWRPIHDLDENLLEFQLLDLAKKEDIRARLSTGSNCESSVPFVSLIKDHGWTSIHSDLFEIFANLTDQLDHRESVSKAKLDQLKRSILNSEEDLSMKRFLYEFYPTEVPQFGYSRVPITRPFSWPQLRRTRAKLIQSSQSDSELNAIRARFDSIKMKSLTTYKLILRYIDSNQKNSDASQEDGIPSNQFDGRVSNQTRSLLKFKLIADYLIAICITESLMRDELYLQLVSLTWQNGRPTSVANVWKLMLNCLACFGPVEPKLLRFLLFYVNDYCSIPRYRSTILELLTRHLIALSFGDASIFCQREYPVTLLEYVANQRQIDCIMLPISAYLDDHSLPNSSANRDSIDHQPDAVNYAMRTLVQLRPNDTAEQVAKQALEVRKISDDNLEGWSLEFQHIEGALSDFSCRLRGDESPLDHLARIELLPQMLELIEDPSRWRLAGQQSRHSIVESIKSAESQISSGFQSDNYSSCCQPCGPVDNYGKSKRKRRNSSSGACSGVSKCQQLSDIQTLEMNGQSCMSSEPYFCNDVAPINCCDYYSMMQPAGLRRSRRSMSMQELQFEASLPRGPISTNYNQLSPYQSRLSRPKMHQQCPCCPPQIYHYGSELDAMPMRRNSRLGSSSSLQQLNRLHAMPNSRAHQASNRPYRSGSQNSHQPMELMANNLGEYELSDRMYPTRAQIRSPSRVADKSNLKRKIEKRPSYEPAMSSAMSDTSETLSMASHVRRVKVPIKGSTADLDRYLDDLFNPMLNEADLDELSDARSMATSIRGTASSPVEDKNSEENVQNPSRVLSPTFECLLKGLVDGRNDSTCEIDACGSSSIVTDDLKSLNLSELKALNEKLESEIEAARSKSNRLSDLFQDPEESPAKIPEPPPLPNFDPSCSTTSEDLYSRSGTRVEKLLWPQTPSELVVQRSDHTTGSENVGRVKISSEMKAKLEKLTTGSASIAQADARTTANKPPKASVISAEQDSVNRIADQRRMLLERQLVNGACSSSDRLSAELGAFEKSGKVLAAKQQLAAAAGVALSALDSKSTSSCNSSRRQSGLILNTNEPRLRASQDIDELGPKSQSAVQQRQIFYDQEPDQVEEMKAKEEIPPPSPLPASKLETKDSELKDSSWIASKDNKSLNAGQRLGKSYLEKSKSDDSERLSQSNGWFSPLAEELPNQKLATHSKRTTPKLENGRLKQLRSSLGDSQRGIMIEADRLCLSYGNVSWKIKLRKEFFKPSEKYDDPLVLQLIFTQLVADVFDPRQWTRLNVKERAVLKSLMKENSIGYAASLPQVGKAEPIKRELIRLARSFGLYFTRSYPALNLALMLDSVVNHEDGGDERKVNEKFEIRSIERHLRRTKQLGLARLDRVAIHHSGLRLVILANEQADSSPMLARGREESNQTLQSDVSKSMIPANGKEHQLGYKVIDTLKYRDMDEIVVLGRHELLVSMTNDKRSWMLSSYQALKLASLLKCFLLDYRRNSMKATDRPELSSNAREQLQESKPTKQANSRPPITKSTRDVEKQQRRNGEDALLASHDARHADNNQQRQISNSLGKLHSMSGANDALVHAGRDSNDTLASPVEAAGESRVGRPNASALIGELEPQFGGPLRPAKSNTKSKKKSSLNQSSVWYDSISRMSNKFNLFGSSRSNDRNSNNRTKNDRQREAQLIQESMQLGLDSWIETKADLGEELGDLTPEGPTSHVTRDPSEPASLTADGEQLATDGGLKSADQQKISDGKYSFLQFALYNFREAIEKYSLDSKSSIGSDTSTLRGSLKLIENLRSSASSAWLASHGGSITKGRIGPKSSEHDDWTWNELAQMVKYTRTPIKRSLIKLPNEDLNRRAIDCFLAMLQYMGDLPESYSDSKTHYRLLEGGEIECVYLILMNCHNYPQLRDEIYSQLVKQTTNNRSSNADSCLRCWRLFSIVAAYFDCSDAMRPYLVKYLEAAAYDKRRAFCSIALICLQNLRKTFKYSGRKNVPSIEEIAATSAGRNSKRQIYRLPGGTERVINTKSTTVVDDIIQEICANMLNVVDPNEMLEFSLYCIADGSDPYTMPLNRDDYILDVTTELIKNHQQYFLIFCRSVWIYPLRLDSKLYIEVIFNQIAPDYIEGLLLILSDSLESKRNSSGSESRSSRSSGKPSLALEPLMLKKRVVKEIARIAALLHRASGTDHMPQPDEIKYLLPRPIISAIKQQSNNSNNNNNNNTNITIHDDIDDDTEHSYLIGSSQNWIGLIQSNWSEMSSFDIIDAKAQFLDILRHWPLFGSSFFACKLIQRDLIHPMEFILALNKLGIQMLDMETHQVVHRYTFNEIISTRKVRSEDGALFLDLKCGNLMKRTIIRIQTDQAHEIGRLIRKYIDIEFIQTQTSEPVSTPSQALGVGD